ncbi:DUF5995 family protein [Kitasatospora sp. MAP5-34]|uniref:DUF5995 family protein n=1 Tax=Kitasatospora sp. MAP5-34 TaxID=3035102 RepID=UPI00247430A3|nr:DUF5995 family protein [Kitasatospora sp. MAP5-34]MDH6577773.1 hypothetical protein [Kitasatospora sp. MAP5-34]
MTQSTDNPLTIDHVVDRLTGLQASLPASDGVAVFNQVYLTVTELIRDQLATTYFGDPAGVARLDAVFEADDMDVIKSAPRAPRMNAHCERAAGSIGREALDHVLIMNEAHARLVFPSATGDRVARSTSTGRSLFRLTMPQIQRACAISHCNCSGRSSGSYEPGEPS